MIYIFYGDDRKRATGEAKTILGKGYEVFDAEALEPADLADMFLGQTLFQEKRKILIQDFFANKALVGELASNLEGAEKGLPQFLDTEHDIVIIGDKFDKRLVLGKTLAKDERVKLQEFKVPEAQVDRFLAFNVFDEAMTNGVRAVKKLRLNETSEEPYMMLGAWASKAQKNYVAKPTEKNKKILKELAKIDIMLKTTNYSSKPWTVLETFLLRLENM
ncbi:MAG: hypothetical protein Q4E47_02350 [Candidatus Saccharibacteria bacterium]|nr:hypothetical protein [Candidatus Saccharibacteria bacterium]